MTCSACGRACAFDARGTCPQCRPIEPTKFYLVERDMEGVNLLRFNEAAKIMETTHDRRYATWWDSQESADRAAEFYAPIWHDQNRGRLRVIRID